MSFKDYSSAQATDYSRYRPHYPRGLFDYLASLCGERDLAWDCGTGNGQAAVELARHFRRVVATDPSAKQLAESVAHPKVEYRRAPAEASGLDDYSANLVTVAQAFHWFDQPKFFAEVRRVTKPGGVLAVWCYEFAVVDENVDATVLRLETNHRSGGSILELANRLMRSHAGALDLVPADATPPAEPVASPQAYDTDLDEARGIAAAVAAEVASGVRPERIAVLYRINSQAPQLEAALAEHGLSTRLIGATRFFDLPSIKQAVLELGSVARTGAPGAPLFQSVSDVLRNMGITRIMEHMDELPALVEAGRRGEFGDVQS